MLLIESNSISNMAHGVLPLKICFCSRLYCIESEPSCAVSHLDHLVFIKTYQAAFAIGKYWKRSCKMLFNRGSTYDALDSLDCIHNPFNWSKNTANVLQMLTFFVTQGDQSILNQTESWFFEVLHNPFNWFKCTPNHSQRLTFFVTQGEINS